MTFPERKYGDIAAFFADYAERLRTAATSLDRVALARAAGVLEELYERRGALYVCGNGGSAAIANTFVCDHAKLVQTDTNLVPRVLSLADNVSMLTAIANDISYDDVFLYQLRTQAQFGDALCAISASGNSANVVRAAAWARDNAMEVIALTGFDGGRLKSLASVSLHVAADNYGVIEDVHQTLMHVLAQYIRQSRMSEGLIANRTF